MPSITLGADLVRFGRRLPSEAVFKANFVRLAGNPEKFSSKNVVFTGIIKRQDSAWYCYNTSEDMNSMRLDSAMILVLDSAAINLKQLENLCDGKLVFIEGFFVARKESELPSVIGVMKAHFIGLN